jgi:alpha-L-rhamnosidase
LLLLYIPPTHAQALTVGKPNALQCDSLSTPLGDDTKKPLFSWKLQDGRFGAKQTAYRILVASNPDLLKTSPLHANKNKDAVWDSGRVESDRSTGILYGGQALTAETRYYWRVQVWDKDGKSYPLSDISWWETGLLDSDNWLGKWISYEDFELRNLRQAEAIWVTNGALQKYEGRTDSRHDFRVALDVAKEVRSGVLYVTGEDTVAAWINGNQILDAEPLPPWGRTPWRTYKRREITAQLHVGRNVLAVEITRHAARQQSHTPMSATLCLEMTTGGHAVVKTGAPGWKTQLNAQGEWYTTGYAKWYSTGYDDAGWAEPVAYTPERDPFGAPDKIGSPLPTGPVVALRRTFRVVKPVVSARLYATALGAYKFSINGKPVGDQVLSPGWTDYRRRVAYQVFDVSSLVQAGPNAMGAYLASGWYSTPLEWIGQGNNYGTSPNALKAQLRIQHTDGSVEWVATDESWKADDSPIVFAEIYDGETYDARRLQPGWDTDSFPDANWHPVAVTHPQEPDIVWQSFQPIRATDVLTAKSVTSPTPGVLIYDFGQNLAGVARIRVQGRTGTDIRLRFAEALHPDGTLYVDNLRNAKATDHYILAGNGLEEYQASFTYHGFRYVEVSGLPDNLGLNAVKAVVLHTDAPLTAQLKTGNPMVDQLWSNILWGQRSNFVGVPTDCPQRDERLGWAGDAQVFWRTASFNFDLTAFSRKYAADLRGTQVETAMYGIYAPGTGKPNPGFAPGWSEAGVIVPWASWIQSGDTKIVQENWTSMEAYLAAIQAANPSYLWKNNAGIDFGDWLAPEGTTSQDLIATAYWAYDAKLMEQMAHAIGRNDEDKYAKLFENIKAAFVRAYVSQDGSVGAARSSPESDTSTSRPRDRVETQTGYVLALHMNLVPESLRPLAAKKLVDRIAGNGWSLATGFLGTPYLLGVLADSGHADVAYRLLMNTELPSWVYMVEHGATTMWERWDSDQELGSPDMNSFNHYAYGAVGEWLYRYSAGIDTTPADPGFHTIVLHPNFDGRLGSVDFSYESAYGTIHSAWTVRTNNVVWNMTIPPNARGRMSLSSEDVQAYRLNGEPLSQNRQVSVITSNDGHSEYELPAGSYTFTFLTSRIIKSRRTSESRGRHLPTLWSYANRDLWSVPVYSFLREVHAFPRPSWIAGPV